MRLTESTFGHSGGIRNLGTTCYLNSLLQVLKAIPPFTDTLDKHTCNQQNCLSCALQNTLVSISPTRTACALPFIKAFHLVQPDWPFAQQNDPGELFNALLYALPSLENTFSFRQRTRMTCPRCGHSYNLPSTSKNSLMVPITGHEASVQDCLDAYFIEEDLDGNNMARCDVCNSNQPQQKQLQLLGGGPFLIVALNRFHYDRSLGMTHKLTTPVGINSAIMLNVHQIDAEAHNQVRHFLSLSDKVLTIT